MEIEDFEVIKRLDAEIKASGSNNKEEESIATEVKDFKMLDEFIDKYNNKGQNMDISEESEEEQDDDEEEEMEEEEMIEEKLPEKKLKKNSAAMDIEQDLEDEDEGSQSNDEEEADEPEINDELAKAIAK